MDDALQTLFDRLPQRVKALARPALRLITTRVAQEDLRPGQSRIGGLPDVPPGFEWPRWQGEPLNFVAQLDVADFASAQLDLPVPRQGSLLFFYESEGWSYYGPGERPGWAVVHVSGPAQAMRRATSPEGLTSAGTYRPAAVRCEAITTVPGPASDYFSPALDRRSAKAIQEYLDAQACSRAPCHLFGGHALCIQGAMECECQLRANGVDIWHVSEADAKRLLPGALDWRLMLQLDSDEATDMMWGDAGRSYFWARGADLAAGRLDRGWVVTQCY